MPRVIHVSGVPDLVNTSSDVFASPLRMQLVRHYRAHPGSQIEAADALGVRPTSVAHNVGALVDAGVLIQERSPDDQRAWSHRVDEDRLAELVEAARKFILGIES